MPDREAIERGFAFERQVAELLDLRLQPGSGNQFYAKSDGAGHGLLVSCKSEGGWTWRKVNKYLAQAIDYSYQTGSIPALAIDDDQAGEQTVVIRLSDLARMLQEEVTIPVDQSKGKAKRERANTPRLRQEHG